MNKHAISDPDQNFFSREYFGFPGTRSKTRRFLMKITKFITCKKAGYTLYSFFVFLLCYKGNFEKSF